MVKTEPFATLTVREFAANEHPHLMDEQFSDDLKKWSSKGLNLLAGLASMGTRIAFPLTFGKSSSLGREGQMAQHPAHSSADDSRNLSELSAFVNDLRQLFRLAL